MEKYPLLNEAIANILRELREAQGLSKRKLAELAWLERVYIIQLEKGAKQPTLNALFYLSEALGLQPSELVKLIEVEVARLSNNSNGK
jgi:transcriptional regulator with XRE-family HTH domain